MSSITNLEDQINEFEDYITHSPNAFNEEISDIIGELRQLVEIIKEHTTNHNDLNTLKLPFTIEFLYGKFLMVCSKNKVNYDNRDHLLNCMRIEVEEIRKKPIIKVNEKVDAKQKQKCIIS